MTGQKVYELAIALMGMYNEGGLIDADNTAIYAAHAPQYINLLQYEIAALEGTVITRTIGSLTDELEISDDAATRALPYGLAMMLVLPEQNANLYNAFELQYHKGKRSLKHAERPVKDVYNVLSGMQ